MSRRLYEATVVLVITVVGFQLRAWRFEVTGLDHFDEGVYAFSGLGLSDWSQAHRLYPGQVQFSPPLFPALISCAYRIAGRPSDHAAIAVNLVGGVLTLPAVWWVTRVWSGPEAGVAAAALMAVNSFHIALSRSALTDVWFSLLFLVGLGAAVKALQTRSLRWTLTAGTLAGLAWNTKYHGWFVLIVAGFALAARGWRLRLTGRASGRYWCLWVVLALVAAMSFLPWAVFIYLEHGGYTSIWQNYRGMLSRDPLGGLVRQLAQQYYWESAVSRGGLPFAMLCAAIAMKRTATINLRGLVGWTTAALVCGQFITTFLAALLFLRRTWRATSLAFWTIAVWILLFVATLPLYRPYSRLMLPLVIACSVAAAIVFTKDLFPSNSRQVRCPLCSPAILSLVSLAAGLYMPSTRIWHPRRSFAEAATAMTQRIPGSSRVIVVGEPALAFYLHLAGKRAFERLELRAQLLQVTEGTYLAAGLYARLAPELHRTISDLTAHLQPLGTFPAVPSELRLLDDLSPAQAKEYLSKPDHRYDIVLYRYHWRH